MLLWKGIGQYVARHPQYRYLFGPVSISDEYSTMSRQLMVAFLEANHFSTELAKQVKARQPMRWQTRPETDAHKCACRVANLDELAALVVELEQGSKGIPILLKQYLNLGARLLGFNVDPEFSNVVDGLILVDLTKTKTKVLEKYMGKAALTAFLAHHGLEHPAAKPEAELELTHSA
jgi:putative hemolysin